MCSLWVGRSQDQPMAQRVKDAGESEGRAVMAWIRVQDLPGAKTSRLPAGVSSRGNRINNFYMGKQMTAGLGLAGAPTSGNAWLPPGRYREVGAVMCWRVSLSRRAFEMLEPTALKGARWVLRGGSGSNATSLPDQPTPPLRHFGPEKILDVQPILPRKWVVLRWRG
jgi:hypothetical protein